jgi:hypothetical protein
MRRRSCFHIRGSMKIIAKVDFSTQLRKGDTYELPESDGKMLIAAGLAEPAPAAPDPPRRSRYQRRDMTAED